MLQAVINAFRIPDLRAKILFTLSMLVIFRVIASIPIPGVDREGLKAFIENNQLLGMLNLFSGSGLTNFSQLTLTDTPDGHCYVTFAGNLIAVANHTTANLTASDFLL